MMELDKRATELSQAETVAALPPARKGVEKRRIMNNRADYLFMAVMLLFPTLQFIIFYITTNLNSFALVMQKISDDGSFVWVSDFRNFSRVFTEVFGNADGVGTAVGNSFIVYGVHLAIMPLAIFFSYYIFKKFVGHRFFKVVLFLPQLISIFTMCYIYFNFTDYATTGILKEKFGILQEVPHGLMQKTSPYLFTVILFPYIIFSFGSALLLYLGAMSGINESILEAAKIDGASNLQELLRIVLPQIYPTIKTFLIVGVAMIFSDQFNLVGLYTHEAPVEYRTIGYYFYQVLVKEGQPGYPYLAAFGLVISAVLIPVTLLINKWLDKLDPTMD